MDRRRLKLEMHDRHRKVLTEQIATDQKRSDAIATIGIVQAVFGFFLWYLRRQRHLDRCLSGGSDPTEPD